MIYKKDDILRFENNQVAIVIEEIINYEVQYLYLGFIDDDTKRLNNNYKIYRVNKLKLEEINGEEYQEVLFRILEKIKNNNEC